MKPRKIPMRMCVGCKTMKPKKELYRIVATGENTAVLDKTSKAPGRGAYICPDEGCLQKALKTRALERALQVKTDESLVHQLKRELARRELQANL
ncbi:MAG: RNase P modulator RnpM [Bacillota bacterium]